MPPLRRCAPTACPDERGTTVRISLDWVSEWRGIRNLAGILRKRLKNLKSHWLDQQVSEAMGRGVDIEQMIELAKGVGSWDDWSDGLESLQPY